MQARWLWSVLGVVVALGAGCSGEGDVGEECGESGVEAGECVEGAICGKHDDTGDLVCITVCKDDADCSSDEACNGVEGSSVKGCRLKPK